MKFFTANLIFLDILLFSVLPLTAQSIDTESEECKNAIAEVENQLQSAGVTLEFSDFNDRNAPGIPPEGRPNQYAFGMSGNGVMTVLGSPVLLDTHATQIVNNCSSVSSVSFGQWQSGLVGVFGLMPNGEVELFKCPEDHFHGGGYRDLVWGEFCST